VGLLLHALLHHAVLRLVLHPVVWLLLHAFIWLRLHALVWLLLHAVVELLRTAERAGFPKNQWVSGYFTKSGRYVSGYWRNSPSDGYSTCKFIRC
jgi:hypothetical protein